MVMEKVHGVYGKDFSFDVESFPEKELEKYRGTLDEIKKKMGQDGIIGGSLIKYHGRLYVSPVISRDVQNPRKVLNGRFKGIRIAYRLGTVGGTRFSVPRV